MITPENPFKLTRAADLDDQQINALWVDLTDQGGFDSKFRPQSQQPMIILGGKGSGKTHLMRHYSFSLQKLRAQPGALYDDVKRSGYLGIYVRCNGLNASRFAGKGQSEDKWTDLFAYYIELWFAQVALTTAIDFMESCNRSWADEANLAKEIYGLFDRCSLPAPNSLRDILKLFRDLQRELDFAINNAALTRTLDAVVLTTRGALIFGIPQLLSQYEIIFHNLTFTWLIDEYENLYENAQRYINTLLRETQLPVTFKIGARLYGIRTYRTLSGNEELKEGSEYELLNLDAELRRLETSYQKFAKDICKTRLRVYWSDLAAHSVLNNQDGFDLAHWFADEKNLPEDETGLGLAAKNFSDKERPWILRLKNELRNSRQTLMRFGIENDSIIDEVLRKLRWQNDLLIEKTNVFLFYRGWSKRVNLVEAASKIHDDCKEYATSQSKGTEQWRVLDKFQEDLKAQVIRECNGKPFYIGLDTFIAMSQGITRNLLTILKHVYDWSIYNGERPFLKERISVKSQRAGIMEAYDWFIRDAQIVSQDGRQVKMAITRLGDLFRAIRFSDKPSECSLCTFSVNRGELEPKIQRIIEAAEQWSLLIPMADRIDRNSGSPVAKYQLSAMIASNYWLPISSRGNISLSTEEATIIFGGGSEGDFDKLRKNRLKGMNVPFSNSEDSNEPTLL